MRVLRSVAVVAVLAVFGAGCSGDDKPAAAPTPVVTSTASGVAGEPSASPGATAGPATDIAVWPDGLTAKLVALERVPSSWGVDVPKTRAIVRMTLEVHNGGTVALPVPPSSRQLILRYGEKMIEAAAVTGPKYADPAERTQKALSVDGDTPIPVGGTARFVESQTVPMAHVSDLTVVVELPATSGKRKPYTLTAAHALLKMVQ
ncbi:hypothetical protein V6V47_13455 [Micromonospora sp. CPCC 205539]|uniref:hypothetical protein n=1 Tax=Micromonospora sp. CPCC 205539 TaxID=3122408 RepID=UPI002FF038BD